MMLTSVESVTMNFFTCFAILGAIFAVSVCFLFESNEENINDVRVIGGETARPGQFPYQVSIRKPYESDGVTLYNHRCGGSILNTRWIVSAAVCTAGIFADPRKLVAVVGAHYFENDGQIHELRNIVNHPSFSEPDLRNNIALLQTVNPIQFNDFVRAIPLNEQVVNEGVSATVSGWRRRQVRQENIYIFTRKMLWKIKFLILTELFILISSLRIRLMHQHNCNSCK